MLPFAPLDNRPVRWLAVRMRRPAQVAAALGLRGVSPCPWGEVAARLEDHRLVITPESEGWILVLGPDIPDATEDVDACFRFLMRLARSVVEVQYYLVCPGQGCHGWVRLVDGQVQRAYLWAGTTLWNQGLLTDAELRLQLSCLDYGEDAAVESLAWRAMARANLLGVTKLAGSWGRSPQQFFDRIGERATGLVGSLVHPKLR
jgi:hypothetical protein